MVEVTSEIPIPARIAQRGKRTPDGVYDAHQAAQPPATRLYHDFSDVHSIAIARLSVGNTTRRRKGPVSLAGEEPLILSQRAIEPCLGKRLLGSVLAMLARNGLVTL